MEISQCDSIDGTYLHNWCMSKKASVKCCFVKEEEKDEDEEDCLIPGQSNLFF